MSFMSCFRKSVFSSKRPISSLSVPAIKLDQIRMLVMRSLFTIQLLFFPGHLRFQPVPTRYTQQSAFICSGFIPITNSTHLWWSRSMAPKAGTYEGCWPVCLWTYVTSEAQAVEHVCTIVRNMFCWSLQSPLSQCAMSGLTEALRANHLHCQHHWPQIVGLQDSYWAPLRPAWLFLTFSAH